jgi:hypothetical protein
VWCLLSIGKINDLFTGPNVSEGSLAVNLTGNHPNLAKFVFDPQQKVLV